MSNVGKDLINIIKQSADKGSKPYDTSAKVTRVDGSTAWVHIPGGVDETPVRMTINAKPGDTVQVRVGGGRAWLTGNGSAPPTDDARAIVADTKADGAMAAANSAVQSASIAKDAADSAVASAAEAEQAAQDAQDSLMSVVQGATTVEKAVSVMQTALEAVVDYDPTTDTTTEYFWHDANGAHVLGDTSGYRNDIDSSGMRIVDTSTEESVADFGADIRLGLDSGKTLNVTSGGLALKDNGTVTTEITGGNSFFEIKDTTTLQEFEISTNGFTLFNSQGDGLTVKDADVSATGDITAGGDLYNTNGKIGQAYSATTSTHITGTNMNTMTLGASVQLPAGTYVITGRWAFPSISSGAKNLQVSIGDSSTTSSWATQRITVPQDNWQSLSVTCIKTLTATTTVYVKGSTSKAYSTNESTTIEAVRIA